MSTFEVIHNPNEPVEVPIHLFKDTRLSISAKFLWIVIWDSKDDHLDIEKYAKIINRCPQTTRKYFKELIDAGYIVHNEKGYEISFDKK
jgi:hypothetical protein